MCDFSPTGSNGLSGPKFSQWLDPPFPATGRGDESPQEQPSKIAGVNHTPPVPVPCRRLRREVGLSSSDSGWGGMDGQIGLTPTAPILGLNLLLSDPKRHWGWFHTPVHTTGVVGLGRQQHSQAGSSRQLVWWELSVPT